MESHFREYARTCPWHIGAKISEDGIEWIDVEVPNISAGGLLFVTNRSYPLGTILSLDLYITPVMLAPTDHIKNVKIVIMSERESAYGLNAYAASFYDMSNEDRIHLDEMVRMTLTRYLF